MPPPAKAQDMGIAPGAMQHTQTLAVVVSYRHSAEHQGCKVVSSSQYSKAMSERPHLPQCPGPGPPCEIAAPDQSLWHDSPGPHQRPGPAGSLR